MTYITCCLLGREISYAMFYLFFPGMFWFPMQVLTAVGYDIGVRLGMPYLHLLPPMVVGQIRNRAGLIGLPDGLYAPAPVDLRLAEWQGLQRFQPERQEPLMLEDIRRDEVEEEHEENGEEEEDQKGSPQADAVEHDEKSDEEEYVLV